jgi:sulfane dehydrogenase subunit SoxC
LRGGVQPALQIKGGPAAALFPRDAGGSVHDRLEFALGVFLRHLIERERLDPGSLIGALEGLEAVYVAALKRAKSGLRCEEVPCATRKERGMALPDDSIYDEKTRKQIDAMVEAEQRYLAAQKAGYETRRQSESGANPGKVSGRRRFLMNTTALAGAAVAGNLPRMSVAAAPSGAVEFPVPPDPTKVQGRPTGDDGGYGSRSQFESDARWRYPTPTKESSWTMSPLDRSLGIITPSGLHFERHHAGIPTIDPAKHFLFIHGMVNKPKKYSMADLKRFPSVSRVYFLECSGNGLTEWAKPTLKTVQGTHGLLSTSEWTGVPLSTLLKEVGVRDGARWVLAEGSDAAAMTRSIPIEKCWDNALLAYGQNGEAIRPEQGYPLRLILPGWEGNTQIKWLRRLEVGDQPYMTREETSNPSIERIRSGLRPSRPAHVQR